MTSRITTLTLARGVLDDVNVASRRLSKTQEQLASGKLLNRPSDDPTAVARAITLRSELEGIQQHSKNVGEAQGWEDVTDSALAGLGDALQRVRELVVQGATDSAGPAARRAIAVEIRGLIDSMKSSANASYGGRYVFSGTATGTRPYAIGGSDAYAGDQGTMEREIGPGVSVAVNVVGKRVLGDEDEGMLATLRGVVARLESGTTADAAALRSGALGALDGHLDDLSAIRAEVGSTANRLDAAALRLGDVELFTRGLLSETEDVDFAEAMVRFSTEQAALQAGLKAGAQIVQASLLDFLR